MRISFLNDTNERVIFFSSLAVKVFFVLILFAHVGFYYPLTLLNSDNYLPLASTLYERHVFSRESVAPFLPEAIHVPGYPLFLAITAVPFGSIFPALIIQALLISFAAVLLYRLVSGFFSIRVAFWGALLFGVEPFNNYIFTSPLSESLFLFLCIAFLYYIRRAWDTQTVPLFFLSGLFLGCAILVRPIVAYFSILFLGGQVLLALYFKKRKIVIGGVVGFLAVLLCVLPWMGRNYIQFETFVISSKGPATFYFYDVEQLIEYRDGVSPQGARDMLYSMAKSDNPEILSQEDLQSPQYASYLVEKSLSIIKETPFLYAKIHILSLGTFFLSDGYRLLWQEMGGTLGPLPNITKLISGGEWSVLLDYFSTHVTTTLLFVFGVLFWGSVTFFALLSLPISFIREKKVFFAVSFFALLIVYFAVLTGPVAQARYRVPVTPFLFTLAAYSYFYLYDWFLKRKSLQSPYTQRT